jgi:translation initiation factor IF-1
VPYEVRQRRNASGVRRLRPWVRAPRFALRSSQEATRNTAAAPGPQGIFWEADLTRDDHVQLDGVVTQVFAGGQFEVKTDAGAVVRAQLSGRMRKNRIRVILGDRVTVALSPYDLSHGMIVYRHK